MAISIHSPATIIVEMKARRKRAAEATLRISAGGKPLAGREVAAEEARQERDAILRFRGFLGGYKLEAGGKSLSSKLSTKGAEETSLRF
jgi:hypothetical protein